jgi:hypothetical protein
MSAAALWAKALELRRRIPVTADAQRRFEFAMKALELDAEAEAQDEEELIDTVSRSERAIRRSRLLIDEVNKILARG